MKVCVIGTGYVGLVTGTCLADLGHTVCCVDSDKNKINLLNKNISPIYEPGLSELIKKNKIKKRLFFSTSIKEGIREAMVVFIAVGTPPLDDGSADLSFIEIVATEIAQNMQSYKVIVDKSTVPVRTGERVFQTIKKNCLKDIEFDVVSNPEFLREGNAIKDTFNPDRIVLGLNSKKAEKILRELYSGIKTKMVFTDINSAELIKHASNSFLAMKISYANALANICEKTGADIKNVIYGMGLDKRIGPAFLDAGIGYGGFCFPKDVSAFIWIAKHFGYEFDLLKDVEKINNEQKKMFIKKIEDTLWIVKNKKIAVWGLSFKPNTDDMRYAPSIDIINALLEKGANIYAYDPVAISRSKVVLKNVNYGNDMYSILKNADCLLILTEWDIFNSADFNKIKKTMKFPLIIDGRNMFEPEIMKKQEITYISIGRK